MSTEPARLDAQSLRDMRDRAEDTLDTPVGHSPGGWWATHAYVEARDVVALTQEVERLVGCVAEAERQAQENLDALLSEREQHVEFERTAAGQLLAQIDWRKSTEAALADARDALTWTRMAMNWAVFQDESRVWTSNEMRDIKTRLDEVLERLNSQEK